MEPPYNTACPLFLQSPSLGNEVIREPGHMGGLESHNPRGDLPAVVTPPYLQTSQFPRASAAVPMTWLWLTLTRVNVKSKWQNRESEKT